MLEPGALCLHAEHLLRLRTPTESDIRRAVSAAYKQVRKVCDAIAAAKGTIPKLFHGLILQPPSTALATLAATFAELQDARHTADYDLDIVPSFREARLRVSEASAALRSWITIASDADASVFLTLLLVSDRNMRRG